MRFQPLESDRRQAFDVRDTWVMNSPDLRNRIAEANELAPATLTDEDIVALVAFLHALTDPSAADRSTLIPTHLPSGLSPQPARRN